jgi:hypothetical protein
MRSRFEQDGLSFRYPADWKLEREDNDQGWTVLLQSPGTGFVTVTLDQTMPELEQVLRETLDTLRIDYPTLEVETMVDTVAGQMAVGHDIVFFALDLPTTCWTRAFQCEQGTVLVLCQSSDLDMADNELIFQDILRSIEAEE